MNTAPLKFKKVKHCLEQYVFTKDKTVQFDPNGILIGVIDGKVSLEPVPGLVCAVTGEEAIGFQTMSMQVALRPDILQRLVLLSLSKKEFKKLFALFPDEHYLEGDFYTETGSKCQPKAEYMPKNNWYIPAKVVKEIKKNLENPEPPHYDIEIF